MAVIPPACPPDTGCQESFDVEWLLLCDDGTMVPTRFWRRVTLVTDANCVQTFEVDDFELDTITPYTVTGTIVQCSEAVTIGEVVIALPSVSVTDCDGNETIEEALPVAMLGRVNSYLCDSQLPLPVKPGTLIPLGHEQLIIGAVAVSLTVPVGATLALITNAPLGSVGRVRWRDDGVAPTGGGTGGVGNWISNGVTLEYSADLSAIQFIRDQPTNGLLDVDYYM